VWHEIIAVGFLEVSLNLPFRTIAGQAGLSSANISLIISDGILEAPVRSHVDSFSRDPAHIPSSGFQKVSLILDRVPK
jgi:hypothetical protein